MAELPAARTAPFFIFVREVAQRTQAPSELLLERALGSSLVPLFRSPPLLVQADGRQGESTLT